MPYPYSRPLIWTHFYRKISWGHPKNFMSKKLFPSKSMTTLDDLTVLASFPHQVSTLAILSLKKPQQRQPLVKLKEKRGQKFRLWIVLDVWEYDAHYKVFLWLLLQILVLTVKSSNVVIMFEGNNFYLQIL